MQTDGISEESRRKGMQTDGINEDSREKAQAGNREMDLFEYMRNTNMEKERPLAARMRPRTLDEVL